MLATDQLFQRQLIIATRNIAKFKSEAKSSLRVFMNQSCLFNY